MCLAYLFEQVHEQNLSAPLDLTAFIVDHKARHESTPEAHSVARLLYQLGNLDPTCPRPYSANELLQESSLKS